MLSLYTIYFNPADFPNRFVVRRFELDQPKEILIVCHDLDTARKALPAGLIRTIRHPDDHISVIETWL